MSHRRAAPLALRALTPSALTLSALTLGALTRKALTLSALTLSALTLSACGGGGGVGGVIQRVDELPAPPPRRAFLRLPDCDARVWIYVDERFKGRVADYPLRALLLPAGARRVELRRHGYATRYHLVTLSPEAPVTLSGDLTPLPAPPPEPR